MGKQTDNHRAKLLAEMDQMTEACLKATTASVKASPESYVEAREAYSDADRTIEMLGAHGISKGAAAIIGQFCSLGAMVVFKRMYEEGDNELA